MVKRGDIMFKLTKGKIAKRLVAGITAGVLCFGTFSVAVPCSAATIKASRTDSMISGKLTDKKGTVLKIVLNYTEVDKSDPHNKRKNSVQNIATGDYDSVSCSRKVTSGYKYVSLMAAGFRNGTWIASASV